MNKDGILVSFVISSDAHKFEKKYLEQNFWRDLEFVFYFNIQWILFICLMVLNRLKLERAVIFIKYIASLVPLIILSYTLIWNKMVISHQIRWTFSS